MRLFSEKVTPTFTSSNLNILTVESFNEVFFDVFEFEINGKKFIAEKVSEYKGAPVVNVPIVLEGIESEAPFVLQEGEFSILFNKDNTSIVNVENYETPTPITISAGDEEIEEIIFERKEAILNDIKKARELASDYAEAIKRKKLQEADQYFVEKEEILKEEIIEIKKSLVEEFLGLVENVKGEIFEYSIEEKERLEKFITESVDRVSTDLIDKINSQQEVAEKRFTEQINKLASNILTGTLLKKIGENKASIYKDVAERINSLFGLKEQKIQEYIKGEITSVNESLLTLEKTNILLNDQINKSSNKALSRIGNVKTHLEESISKTAEEIETKIIAAKEQVSRYYEDKISVVENKLNTLTEENKTYIVGLINESKKTLLNEIEKIKIDAPDIIISEANGGQNIDLKSIKKDLEKVIGNKFTTEIQSLKRLIEMSSGGGSVAMQFAEGGTMEGNLTVVGSISAKNYLGITIPSGSGLTGDYLPLSGGTVTGSISATSLSATNIFASNLTALSANITVIDIKQYELSGFNVTGDVTIQGSISASEYKGLVIPNPDLSQYLPLSGGTLTGILSSNSNITTTGTISSNSERVVTSPDTTRIVTLTQAQYDAIPVPDPSTFYIIIDATPSGPVTLPIKNVSNNYTVLASDYTLKCTGTITLSLPTAIGNGGNVYNIKNFGTGTITVSPVSGETIDGQSSLILATQYINYTLQSDNSNWIIL